MIPRRCTSESGPEDLGSPRHISLVRPILRSDFLPSLMNKNQWKKPMRLSNEKGPAWLRTGTCCRGETLLTLGQVEEGIAHRREGMATRLSMGARCYLPRTPCSLSEPDAQPGHTEEGLTRLAEAVTLEEQTDQRHWEVERHRARPGPLLTQAMILKLKSARTKRLRYPAAKAPSCGSCGQRRVWPVRGRSRAGRTRRDRCWRIDGWFTEGFDTLDLKEAEALPAGFSGPASVPSHPPIEPGPLREDPRYCDSNWSR